MIFCCLISLLCSVSAEAQSFKDLIGSFVNKIQAENQWRMDIATLQLEQKNGTWVQVSDTVHQVNAFGEGNYYGANSEMQIWYTDNLMLIKDDTEREVVLQIFTKKQVNERQQGQIQDWKNWIENLQNIDLEHIEKIDEDNGAVYYQSANSPNNEIIGFDKESGNLVYRKVEFVWEGVQRQMIFFYNIIFKSGNRIVQIPDIQEIIQYHNNAWRLTKAYQDYELSIIDYGK
jgi:hypothetical protein